MNSLYTIKNVDKFYPRIMFTFIYKMIEKFRTMKIKDYVYVKALQNYKVRPSVYFSF